MPQRRLVSVMRDGTRRGVEGRRVAIGRIDVASSPSLRRDRQHPGELAAPEDADRRAGAIAPSPRRSGFRDRFASGVAPRLQPFGELGVADRQHARGEQRGVDCAGLPMASVPTGMPAGIWTME